MKSIVTVPSFTTRGRRYQIVKDAMLFKCDCPVSAFRDKRCKHVNLFLTANAAVMRCHESGHTGRSMRHLCFQCFVDVLAEIERLRQPKRRWKR